LRERGVVAIIGSSYSRPTIALAIEAAKDGIPVISPTASDPAVTKGRRNVFRAIFIDDYQARAMAYFAYNSLNARTAVIFSNRNYDSYIQASKVFAESFAAHGGRIIAIESYSSEKDFDYLLRKHAANPPDVIFCPDNYIPAARLVNTAYKIGFRKTSLLGSDAWDGILTYVYNPRAMENAYYSAPFSFDDPDEKVVRFVRNYFDSFAQMPLSGSATAYICVHILAEAITIAGNTNKNNIISAIKENEFDTITGSIKFDENNNPHTSVYVIQIKNGQYSTYKKLRL
jgi:branched-chain amino acid transport system substrate-binding protein